MDKSTAPFGENDMWQSAHKKIFELATASPADFFVHISPHLVLSNIQDIVWWSNKIILVLFKVGWSIFPKKIRIQK